MSFNISLSLREEKKVIKAPSQSDLDSESEEIGDRTFRDELLETTLPFRTTMSRSIDVFQATGGIPEFTGDGHELGRFLNLTDIQYSRGDTPEYRKDFLKAIMSRISGKAYEQTIEYSPPESWEELRKNLVLKFTVTRDVQLIQHDIFLLTQKAKEEVSFFGIRAERLLSELNRASMPQVDAAARDSLRNWNEATVTGKFVQGLHENIRTIVRTARATTLNEAIRLAIEEEKIIQLHIKSIVQNNPRYCQNCNNTTHNTVDCRRRRQPLIAQNQGFPQPYNNPQSSTYQPNQVQSQNRPPNQQFLAKAVYRTLEQQIPNSDQYQNQYQTTEQRHPEITTQFCRYCKKNGHVIDDCRKRKFNNDRRQGNGSQPGPSTQ